MGVFEGMLSGFTGRKAEYEQENLRQAELANAREAKIYEALVNSPDPEIRSMAVTGLLDSAKPSKRKGGFRGWLGEMEANPALGRIKDLLGTPVTSTETTTTPGLPSVQTSGYLSTPPGQQSSLAMPEGNAVTPGQPPITPVESRMQSEIVPGPAVGRIDTRTVTRPREAFRSPEEQTRLGRKAAAQGDVEGEVAGLIASGIPDTEARQLIADKYRRAGLGSAPFAAIAGTMPDGSDISAVFDRSTGKYRHPVTGQILEGFVARQTGASAPRFGVNREAIAEAEFGANFDSLTQPQKQIVMRKEQEYFASTAQNRIEGAGAGRMNVPSDFRTSQLAGVPVGSRAAQALGQRVGSIAQQTRRTAAGEILGQLDHIKTLLSPLPKQGELGALAPGATMAIRQRTPAYRESLATLTSAINNIRASLTRTMQANVGTETEKDAERALSTLVDFEGRLLDPLRGDTQESATARLNETIDYLKQIIGSMPGAPQLGAPPPGVGAAGASTLDTPVAGWFVDDAGNLVQR
jgi:hypothetical protein